MKHTPSLQSLLAAAALALAMGGNVQAQEIMPASDESGGLLGQTYTGVEYGYVRVADGPPNALHRYGFISSRPLQQNVDAAFKYNYTHGSAFGTTASQHDIAVSFTGFLSRGLAKPYLQGDAGWARAKVGGARDSSFIYLLGGGVEFQVTPRATVIPFVNYQEARAFHDRAWNFGAKGGFRLNRGWGAVVGITVDDDHDVEYSLGVHRRF